jgi:HSP20 family protein
MKDKSWMPGPWGGRDVDPLRGFRTQIDSLFEDWFGRSMGGMLAPRIDVSETDQELRLSVELPGVDEKDIDVSLVGDQLTIKGEKKSEQQDKQDDDGRVFHRVERSYGAFRRSMTLPFEADPDNVSADFKNGVLTVTLPKPAGALDQAKTRKIEVKRTV